MNTFAFLAGIFVFCMTWKGTDGFSKQSKFLRRCAQHSDPISQSLTEKPMRLSALFTLIQQRCSSTALPLNPFSVSLTQEWMLSLLFLPLMFIVGHFMMYMPYPEVPHKHLGQLDDPAYNATGVTIAFTPITAATRQIMNTVASKSVMTGMIYLLNSSHWYYSAFYTRLCLSGFPISAISMELFQVI